MSWDGDLVFKDIFGKLEIRVEGMPGPVIRDSDNLCCWVTMKDFAAG